MLQLKNIYKSINYHVIFENLNLTFPSSGLFFLVGENGCGKSTLLYIIAGLDNSYAGDYLFDGKKMKDCSEKELDRMRRKEIGVLFSHGNLFDFMDVNENRNFDLKDTPLNLVSLSNDQPVHFLSGGEELLLAMENEFAKHKKIYLLDEVTSALDEQNLNAVMDILIKQSKNSLILMATHDRRIMNCAKNILISSITNFHQTSEE